MALRDPLDFAKVAIENVSHEATNVGKKHGNTLCGELGAELFLTAQYIDVESMYQEEKLRIRIFKLLREVEEICNWPRGAPRGRYPLLETVANDNIAPPALRQGIINFTSGENYKMCTQTIKHLRKFQGSQGNHKLDNELDPPRKSDLPVPQARDTNSKAHKVLRGYMSCVCTCNGKSFQTKTQHQTRLLLQPPPEGPNPSEVKFDLLFSSSPSSNKYWKGVWQDVQLLLPCVKKKRGKKVKLSGQSEDREPPKESNPDKTPIEKGYLCTIIGKRAPARVRLKSEDSLLHRTGTQPLERIIAQSPGISLAELLTKYRLTSKMKLALGYILASSLWQYFESDWMNKRWNSRTIKFMKEKSVKLSSDPNNGSYFATKPYLTVDFEEHSQLTEFSCSGAIHPYPSIQALGTMLLAVALGPHFSSRIGHPKSIDDEYYLGIESLNNDTLWKKADFQFKPFIVAVERCFDTDIFASAVQEPHLSEKEQAKVLDDRRVIIYESIVFPLHDILTRMEWTDGLTDPEPPEPLIQEMNAQNSSEMTPEDQESNSASSGRPIKRGLRKNSENEAIRWLKQMNILNKHLADLSSSTLSTARRARVAILDTGCDLDAPFFFSHDTADRIQGWKDWVGGSEECLDSDGHGTHLVSLIMKIAPEADVFVARVIERPENLGDASETIAKAILWASQEWNTDIISMSFGYADEYHCISNAIHRCLQDRQNSILFFAAASNSGGNQKETWPARHDSVFSVRGTNFHGKFQDYNPPVLHTEAASFGTLGLDVPGAWLSSHAEQIPKSGTSIATAVAAALAGVLLGYANGKQGEPKFDEVSRKLRTRSGMHAMLSSLSVETDPKCLYLRPWDLAGIDDYTRWAKFVGVLSSASDIHGSTV